MLQVRRLENHARERRSIPCRSSRLQDRSGTVRAIPRVPTLADRRRVPQTQSSTQRSWKSLDRNLRAGRVLAGDIASIVLQLRSEREAIDHDGFLEQHWIVPRRTELSSSLRPRQLSPALIQKTEFGSSRAQESLRAVRAEWFATVSRGRQFRAFPSIRLRWSRHFPFRRKSRWSRSLRRGLPI